MMPLRIRFRSVLVILILVMLLSIFLYKRHLTDKYFEDNFGSSAIYLPRTTVDERMPKLVVLAKMPEASDDEQAGKRQKARSVNKAEQIETGGCKLADLKLNDPELSHFFQKMDPLVCSDDPDWVSVGNGTFEVNSVAIQKHGNISCRYTNFWRVGDHKTASETKEDFTSGSLLEGDFFKVKCKAADGSAYSNVHAGIRPSEAAKKRSVERPLPPHALKGMNVYMMGLDSISRMTFMRKLPKLFKYLTEHLGSVVLKGYNVVGDGTPQALIPILTGKTEVELPLTRKRYANAHYVNVYPFVWQDYANAGYATLYGEDSAQVGTFTYRLKGFDAQPTDHYMRTFYVFAEDEYRNHRKFCLGSLPHHVAHFRYVEKFFDAYPNMPKFAFQFHSLLSHDDINYVEMADDDLVTHLRYLEDNMYLNNTMLIVFADHGHRFAKLRETQQGKLEERLPFFSIRLPSWFEAKYPHAMKNLRLNSERLTSPFDIYPTLRSILDFSPFAGDAAIQTPADVQKNRSISLFYEIPASRDCADADIEPHWCTCMSWEAVPPGDPLVKHIARGIVSAINNHTASVRKKCASLSLKSIDRSLRYRPSDSMLKYKKAKDLDGFEPDLSGTATVSRELYQINLHTSPGDAHYECSVTLNRLTDEVVIDLDQISHINAYGDLPACIVNEDYFMAKWCVCYDKIQS